MCLTLVASAKAADRERFEEAVRKAAATGLRVEILRRRRWPWTRETSVRAEITEDGACACGLLSDDADWNADVWAMRPDILEPLARTVQILAEEGPPTLAVEALWIGDAPNEIVLVTATQLAALARLSKLGTHTRYELISGGYD